MKIKQVGVTWGWSGLWYDLNEGEISIFPAMDVVLVYSKYDWLSKGHMDFYVVPELGVYSKWYSHENMSRIMDIYYNTCIPILHKYFMVCIDSNGRYRMPGNGLAMVMKINRAKYTGTTVIETLNTIGLSIINYISTIIVEDENPHRGIRM